MAGSQEGNPVRETEAASRDEGERMAGCTTVLWGVCTHKQGIRL